MATYYDALNDFHKLNEQEPLASSAQLLYLHLLHTNNRHGNSGHVQVSDRELGHRTRLSKQTITEAKRILKSAGLIDFTAEKGNPRAGTSYALTFFSEKVGQLVGQSVGQNLGQTLGQKVGQSSRYKSIFTNESLDKDLRQKKETKDITSTTTTARTRDTSSNVTSSVDMDIHEVWEYETGQPLRGSVAFELERLANADFEGVREAIIAAVKANSKGTVSFNYFKAVYENAKGNPTPKANPLSQKGGEKSERPARIDYGEEPDCSWIK